MTVDEQIANFAASIDVRLERLLLVDVTGFSTTISLRSQASALLGDSVFPIAMSRLRKLRNTHYRNGLRYNSVGPWFLDALAAPLVLAIVSDETFIKEFVKEDLYQNIRHKCLVHFVQVDAGRRNNLRGSMNGIPTFEVGRKASGFFSCNRRNSVFSWKVTKFDNKPRACAEAEPVRVGLRKLSKRPKSPLDNYEHLRFDLTCSLNTSLIEFHVDVRPIMFHLKEIEHLHFFHTAFNSIVGVAKFTDCVTLLELREVNIFTLLEPFSLFTWIAFASSVVLLSAVHAFAGHTSFVETVFNSLFNFINSTSIAFGKKKCSVLLICLLTVAMNFYVGNFYGNDVITRFVDPSEPAYVDSVRQCRFASVCNDIHFTLRYMQVEKTALCGLSDGQKRATGFYLQRVEPNRSVTENEEKLWFTDMDEADALFLEFGNVEIKRKTRGFDRAKLLTRALTQRVPFYARIVEHGIIPESVIYVGEVKYTGFRKMIDAFESSVLTKTLRKFNEMSPQSRKFLPLHESRGEFDMRSLVRLTALFLFEGVMTLFIFCLEESKPACVARIWEHLGFVSEVSTQKLSTPNIPSSD